SSLGCWRSPLVRHAVQSVSAGWLAVRSADAGRAELHADARAARPGCLRYGVLPGALAGAAHDEQVTVAKQITQRGAAASDRAHRQRARIAERDDRDDRLAHLPAQRVTVPGDAVAAVAVQA